MITTEVSHRSEAAALLRMADTARNSDGWVGDRNADSQALGTIATAHALLALEATLSELVDATIATAGAYDHGLLENVRRSS